MSEPKLVIELLDQPPAYQPGDTLTAEYRVNSLRLVQARTVEVSVLWYTEGKGEEDMAVHYFQRIVENDDSDLRRRRRFSTVLPNSPLSYDGAIVKIRWCVRVRAFLDRGRELVAEEPFRLGLVPRVKTFSSAETALLKSTATLEADEM